MKVFKSEKGRDELYQSYNRLLKQWGIEVSESDIETKFGVTHVLEAGKKNKRNLMLFHGVGDNSAMMWIYNAKVLAKKFHVIAIDAIGGAGKSMPSNKYGKEFSQTQWISELMTKLNIKKTDVAGVSYGCYLAQLVKIELPDRINRIIGMAGTISVEGGKSNTWKMIKAFLPEALFPNDKNVIKLLKKLTGSESESLILDGELMKHWKLMLRHFNNASMTYHKLKKFQKEDFIRIRDDSLFIIGDHDILSYYPGSLDIMRELGMQIEIIKNAGHIVNHEKPDIINEKIIRFLDVE